MQNNCQVCSSQPSKYTCPKCGLLTCSLGCTQSHKAACTPKRVPLSPNQHTQTLDDGLPVNRDKTEQGNSPSPEVTTANKSNNASLRLEDIAASDQLKYLFEAHPTLRQKLREIYWSTLEEAWPSSPVDQEQWTAEYSRGRGSHRGRGGRHQQHATRRNPGPWNTDKGFRRGLGRVRRWRESCEQETSTGSDAEGFMKFVALVNGNT